MSKILVAGKRLSLEPARRGISLFFAWLSQSEVRQTSRQDTLDVKRMDG